ncbi:MAG: GFA family protein [Rhizobiales bacterium]|nr:GFA family protein [Hyphomicrobiales bacterium]
MEVNGQCHCGQISFAAMVDPSRVSICHCSDCQALTGSPFRVTVLTARDNIRLSSAALKMYVKVGDSGGKRRQYFCPECGTPMFTSGDDETSEWGIRWGCIRQRADLKPMRQIWRRSAVSWLGEVDQLPSRATD